MPDDDDMIIGALERINEQIAYARSLMQFIKEAIDAGDCEGCTSILQTCYFALATGVENLEKFKKKARKSAVDAMDPRKLVHFMTLRNAGQAIDELKKLRGRS